MCDNAWAWAKENSLWRINPVHKEEECKLVVDDEFKYNVHQSQSSEQSGAFQLQVGIPNLAITNLMLFNILPCTSFLGIPAVPGSRGHSSRR